VLAGAQGNSAFPDLPDVLPNNKNFRAFALSRFRAKNYDASALSHFRSDTLLRVSLRKRGAYVTEKTFDKNTHNDNDNNNNNDDDNPLPPLDSVSFLQLHLLVVILICVVYR
jgi:hypothetical protein